jgi:hypothetical protein
MYFFKLGRITNVLYYIQELLENGYRNELEKYFDLEKVERTINVFVKLDEKLQDEFFKLCESIYSSPSAAKKLEQIKEERRRIYQAGLSGKYEMDHVDNDIKDIITKILLGDKEDKGRKETKPYLVYTYKKLKEIGKEIEELIREGVLP